MTNVNQMKIRMLGNIREVIGPLAFAMPAGAFYCNNSFIGGKFDSYDVVPAIPRDSASTLTVTIEW